VPGPVALTRLAAPRQSPAPPPSRPVPGTAGVGPVERLGRRLQALAPEDPQRYAVCALSAGTLRDPGWQPVTGVLPAMLGGSGDHLRVSPAVAGARIAGSLGYAVAGRLAVALAVSGQAYDAGPDSLMVHLDDEGLIDRVGVRNPVVVTAAAIAPWPGPVARFVDLAAVIAWAADRTLTTLAPLIDELQARTHYGRMPMWNLVADAVLSPVTLAPQPPGTDPGAGRAAGSAFLDALVDRGAPISRRGTLRPSGTGEPIPVRGSCCLYYRQDQPKCDSCPLTTPR